MIHYLNKEVLPNSNKEKAYSNEEKESIFLFQSVNSLVKWGKIK